MVAPNEFSKMAAAILNGQPLTMANIFAVALLFVLYLLPAAAFGSAVTTNR